MSKSVIAQAASRRPRCVKALGAHRRACRVAWADVTSAPERQAAAFLAALRSWNAATTSKTPRMMSMMPPTRASTWAESMG